MSPRQFVILSAAVALSSLGVGLWLSDWFLLAGGVGAAACCAWFLTEPER
jgi:hypothetical protein